MAFILLCRTPLSYEGQAGLHAGAICWALRGSDEVSWACGVKLWFAGGGTKNGDAFPAIVARTIRVEQQNASIPTPFSLLVSRVCYTPLEIVATNCRTNAHSEEGFGTMATSERRYILRSVDGEEFGPIDQDCLMRWAENGRITAYCEIRSTLLPRWEKAKEVSFLRDIIAQQQQVNDEEHTPSVLSKIKSRIGLKATKQTARSGLTKTKVQDYELVGIPQRLASGISDMVMVFIYALCVYFVMAFFIANGLDADIGFYLGFIIFYIGAVMYFAWTVSFQSQTIGHRVWGLLLVSDDEDVFLGRGFMFSIGVIFFWFLTPFAMYVTPSGRALQDLISGTYVVKTRVIATKKKRK